jgi:hypothetical protein
MSYVTGIVDPVKYPEDLFCLIRTFIGKFYPSGYMLIPVFLNKKRNRIVYDIKTVMAVTSYQK